MTYNPDRKLTEAMAALGNVTQLPPIDARMREVLFLHIRRIEEENERLRAGIIALEKNKDLRAEGERLMQSWAELWDTSEERQ